VKDPLNELTIKYINAPVTTEPWNHILIDNFLPEDYLKFILNKFATDTTPPDNFDDFHYPYAQVTSPEEVMTHDEWMGTSRLFKNDTFKKTLFKRWGIEYDGKIECKFAMHRDQKGFYQDPHNDIKEYAKEVITMQVYCPPDESLKHLGTSLYNSGVYRPDLNGTEYHSTIDFIPNRCVSFKCEPYTWHGVFPFKEDTNNKRNSLRLLYYVPV
jgi:hypothetical protein